MKTIIPLLALATALCGQGPTTNEVKQPALDYESLFIKSGTKSDVTITTKYDIVWVAENAAGKLLSVNGITQIVPVPLTGNHNIWLTRHKAPEKPEEIVVHVWTADGRKWVAKWEEVKP